ncbi:MAG: PaaI family thioesterase [Deltaproteobacteria bacterium]|nr:PaaI family thioesterase [Deltaproteobacteria bacterium]
MIQRKVLTKERADFLKKDYERGFIKFCKLEAVSCEWGRFHSQVRIDETHRQQDGFIHAGVMATMADHTAGYSAFTIVPEDRQILTVEFKINFLRPAFGERLVCRARVIREGRKIIVAESEVFDLRGERETPAAKAMVTLMAVPKAELMRHTRPEEFSGDDGEMIPGLISERKSRDGLQE